VNATPLGMGGTGCIVPDLEDAKEDLFVADAVYGDFTTDLIKMAQEKGLRNMNGLGMLYHQAFLSFGIWHGLFPG
jgi:shikimate dehydrogenase